jgi:hypothetical protein
MSDKLRFLVAPTELTTVRNLSHNAIQWASRAARANLIARSDDSHSNLGWHEKHAALISHPLDEGQSYQLGFRFRDGSLIWIEDGAVVDALALAGIGEATADGWCNEHLAGADLNSTELADMPYMLDPVNCEEWVGAQDAVETLGAWFSAAQVALDALVTAHGAAAVATPNVRCWPHHYDIATLFALDDGDAESARSVGIGLSPGDSAYSEPYLYCNPWPVPGGALPVVPEPLRWHTEGFTSLVCPASRMGSEQDLGAVSESAFSVVLGLLHR